MVATSCLWFTFNFAVHFRPKMALPLEFSQTKRTRYLGIVLATHFSSSSLVLEGLNLHSAICFEATCSLRTDKQPGNNVTSVDECSTTVTAQQLGDRIMHIMHIF